MTDLDVTREVEADATQAPKWDLTYTKMYPELGTGPIPVHPYVSPEYFERERERIFKRSWLCIGTANDIPDANDYLVVNLEVASASIIVTRGRDNVVRAFHNVCAHRGDQICQREGAGHGARIVCPFHNWVYDNTGRLVVVPDEELFVEFDRDRLGLTPVACEVWEGLIFINLDQEPEESLQEFLGEMYGVYDGFMEGYEFVAGYSMTVECNWKSAEDAFIETYHFHGVHRRTIGDWISGPNSPAGHIVAAELYKKHKVVSTGTNYQRVLTPTEVFIITCALNLLGGAPRTLTPDPPGVNPTNHPEWQSDITIFFPNFQVTPVGFDYRFPIWFWPVDHRTTKVVLRFYARKPVDAAQKLSHYYFGIRIRDAGREDVMNCEFVQRGLQSGAKKEMFLQDREIAIRHKMKVIQEIVGE